MSTDDLEYRFPDWKDATWNSKTRHHQRYRAVAEFLGSDSVGAEIGVYKGGFAEYLKLHCRKLYLVDLWYRAGGLWHSGIPNDSRVKTVINLLSIYQNEIEMGQVEIVIESSMNFLRSCSDSHFDFIYVDASHKFDHTILELRTAGSKIKPGGYIMGDDYNPNPQSRQHGVYRAVNAFIDESDFSLVKVDDFQFVLKREAYQEPL